jgi:predicted HNH restriction endonuclease
MPLPGPIFKSDEAEPGCITGSALVKILMTRGKTDYRTLLSILSNNLITGHESEAEMASKISTKNPQTKSSDEVRQFREYIHFLAQGTFIAEDDEAAWVRGLSWPLDTFSPIEFKTSGDEERDILELGKLPSSSFKYIPSIGIDEYLDILVSEGKATTHTTTRYERSPELRAAYQAKHGINLSCDICGIVPKSLYKTKSEVIELHHVMPLSSLQEEAENGINDLVSLCPTCHKAIHARYSQHLKSLSRTYFADKEEAWRLYSELKTEFKIQLSK